MFKGQILGRLGRDAAVYESANGTQFLAFTLAVNTRNMGKDVTYWVDVRSFHPNHVKLKQYLQKGKIIQVGGDLNATIETDKVGVVRLNQTLFADYINFINLGNSGKDNNRSTSQGEVVTPQVSDDEITMGNTQSQVNPQVEGEISSPVPVMSGGDSDDLPF
jgi:single stranded DNA-binding protein